MTIVHAIVLSADYARRAGCGLWGSSLYPLCGDLLHAIKGGYDLKVVDGWAGLPIEERLENSLVYEAVKRVMNENPAIEFD